MFIWSKSKLSLILTAGSCGEIPAEKPLIFLANAKVPAAKVAALLIEMCTSRW
ncbi:hypothetical protein [Halanaerobium saccharolyticum]|uniref:hypothetical protein n=1 Tax=Halanaerobium saccharolyticum TaxID=43595 RepID=UPI00135F1818|nr:hypothetical protein [Halanaerobium saccharolyticum]